MSNSRFKYPLMFLVTTFSLVVSLTCPSYAYADDDQPPIEPTTEVISANPPPTDPAAEVVNSDLSVDNPVATPSAEESLGDSVTQTVQVMDEAGLVLVDENSQPVPLVSPKAAELLTDPDPYIIRSGITYSFTAGDCDPLTAGAQPCSNPIQQAINFALPGEAVHVESGTFTEQVSITKSLSLLGAGAGVSIIQAPSTLTPDSYGYHEIVLINGAGVTAEVSGFTITGPGPSCGGSHSINAGIFVAGGATANIHDNTISDIHDNPFSGCQNGVGIVVGRAAFGTTGNAVIEDNTITGYQKGGIVVSNTGSTAQIIDNIVTGAGPLSASGSPAQNGIQISSGATALIQGNTISGNDYDVNSSTVSTGILLFSAGNVDVRNNSVNANDVNLYVLGGGNVNILENVFSGSDDDGVFIDGTLLNISLTDNVFTGNVEGLGTNSNVDLSKLIVTNNVFNGNGIGITNYSTTNTLDATGNYWGCADGPDNPLCDQVSTYVIYDPHLTKNPFAQNPVVPTVNDQKSFHSRQSSNPFLIPVTGGELTKISCVENPAVLSLGDTKVAFTGLCGYNVILTGLNLETLPFSLNTNEKFLFGLNIVFFKDGALVDKLPEGVSVKIIYPSLGIAKEWNSEINEWQDIDALEVEGHAEVDADSGTFILIGK